MMFEVRKFSDHGANHPVVARLGAQSHELMKWIKLEKSQRDALGELYISTLMRALLSCHDTAATLAGRIEEALASVPKQEQSRVRHMPSMPKLKSDAETFLYQAKNFLRDQLVLLEIVYDKKFADAVCWTTEKKDNVLNWALEEFGEDDSLCRELRNDSNWILEVIRMRNAVEHPGGYSGHMLMYDFEAKEGAYIRPSWQRTGQPRCDILRNMDVILDNLLTFSEEMLVHCIKHRPQFPGMEVAEIPEAERNPDFPQRLQIVPGPKMLALMKVKPSDSPN